MKTEFNMKLAVKNIIAMRRKAKPEDVSHGIAWYAEAYEQCRIMADRYDLPIYIVAGVVAALSPNNRWSTNVTNAYDLINAWHNDDTPDNVSVCTYNAMKLKAWSILREMPDRYEENDTLIVDEVKTILNGKKIVCFYENIMGDDTCTIDGHARNIAYNERVNLTDNKTSIGVKEYANLQDAYRIAASRCRVNGRRLKAYELQAITWVTWRKLHGIA
mgnify:FL=1|tara:strand:+ start:659 stop:1309 length:651 start_codon:yes stop_codon:yes gene_type:complete